MSGALRVASPGGWRSSAVPHRRHGRCQPVHWSRRTAELSTTSPPAVQNPVPLGELTPKALGCGNPGGAPGTLASGGAEDEQERRRSL